MTYSGEVEHTGHCEPAAHVAQGHQAGIAAQAAFQQLTMAALWPNKGLTFRAMSDFSTLTHVFTQQLQLKLPEGAVQPLISKGTNESLPGSWNKKARLVTALKTKNFSFHRWRRLLCTQDGELEGRSDHKLQKLEDRVGELSKLLGFCTC